jgi:hypothetical protein
MNFEILAEEKIIVSKYKRYIKLSLGQENYWFIVMWRNHKDFHENEEKLLRNTAASFVAIIHQKRILDDTRNQNYVKSAL